MYRVHSILLWFAYRKFYGIIGGYANNLGIKDRDFQISDTGVDENNSDRTGGYQSVPDIAGGYGNNRYRKNGNDFGIPKRRKG